jgi:hypothetical protein
MKHHLAAFADYKIWDLDLLVWDGILDILSGFSAASVVKKRISDFLS